MIHGIGDDIVTVTDSDGTFAWLTVTEKAKEVYASGLFGLYALWDDGTESEIMSYEMLDEALCDGVEIAIEVGHVVNINEQ